MTILDMVGGANGPAAQQLATQFGLPPQQAAAALSALLPMVTAGLQRETTTKGEAGLATQLASGRHENFLAQPEVLAQPATTLEGNAILGHIFGNKDVSRQVATNAAQKTGIDPALLKKMLPVIATIVMAALARQTRNPGSATSGAPGTNPGATGGMGGLGGLLGSLLDRDKDGSVMDELGGMLGGALGRKI